MEEGSTKEINDDQSPGSLEAPRRTQDCLRELCNISKPEAITRRSIRQCIAEEMEDQFMAAIQKRN
ncbi:hypothetical protein GcC1_070017 [Golovinomyces cichoracearum]|uniref:Uncharacterized protein n=1 Tax=Golovinomyces cichoracearum TaxID=62708 RepID=A0A420IPV5_9PEZI|nr:hypothetical protein GcC1_070017 [Golovinomyces cichoracearum]